MIYTESEKDSLRRFMRVESPLATYARSLRNDASASAEVEPDLMKGIDVDNLPDDLKAKLEEANGKYKETFKTAKAKETEATKALELARNHQARADRNFEILRKHNLVDETGKTTVNAPDAKVASLQKSADRIAKEMNIKPEVASDYAKLFQIEREEMKKELMVELGTALNPTFQTVGSLQTDHLLNAAMNNDAEGILQIKEVYDVVNDNLQALVQSGTQIIPETIQNLKDMAYGKYVLGLKPEEREKVLNKPNATANFSTRRGGSAVADPVIPVHCGGTGTPTAANAETAAAVASTVALMTKGMKAKGAK